MAEQTKDCSVMHEERYGKQFVAKSSTTWLQGKAAAVFVSLSNILWNVPV